MIVSVKASDLEVGMFTEYGFVADLVAVSDYEVIINFVDDLIGYDNADTDVYDQIAFEPDDVLSYAVEDIEG